MPLTAEEKITMIDHQDDKDYTVQSMENFRAGAVSPLDVHNAELMKEAMQT